MATVIQNNGVKPLTNGNLNHVGDVENLENGSVRNAVENDIYDCPDVQNTVGEQEVQPEIDVLIRNVVCSFNVRCHLNLREIALKGSNVEYKRESGVSCNIFYSNLFFLVIHFIINCVYFFFFFLHLDDYNEVKKAISYSFNLVIR